MTTLQAIPPLTQLQRERARENARKALLRKIGNAPQATHYMHTQFSKYPNALRNTVIGFAVVICVLGFIPSAIRIYSYASHEFLAYIPNAYAAIAAALAITLLAEATQIAFSLAAAMVHEDTQSGRMVFNVLAWGATAFAIVGNVSVVQPGDVRNLFAWFDALWPPLLVLGAAYALKQQGLHSIEQRHAGKVAYEEALQAWTAQTQALEDHAQWDTFYANALMDALRSARRRQTESLTHKDMLRLAWRELRAEDTAAGLREIAQEAAHAKTQAPMHVPTQPQRNGNASSNGQHTGEVSDALHGDGKRIACPYCDWEKEYDTPRQAQMGYTAHLRKHPERHVLRDTIRSNGHAHAAPVT